MGEMKDDDVNESCPKKLIYFNPPILRCDKFTALTKVTDYQFNITATNMPEWYTLWVRRLEQLYTSFTTGVKPAVDWEKQINMIVTSPVGHRFMNLSVNGIHTDVLDIANVFNSDHDVKHHTVPRMLEEYGILSELVDDHFNDCSINYRIHFLLRLVLRCGQQCDWIQRCAHQFGRV